MKAGQRMRFLKGIGANLYGQAVVALIQIAGVPILLHCWGARTYGEWLIAFALPSYLSMTDLGFSQSAGNDMTRLVAGSDRTEALAVFQSVLVLLIVASAAMSLLVFASLWATPASRLLHLGTLSPLQVKFVLALLAAEILFKLFDGLNHAGFRANGAYALHQTITSTTPLLQNGAAWGAACLGASPLGAAFLYFMVRAIAVPATMVLLVWRYDWLRIGVRRARRFHLARLFKPALGNIAIPLAQGLGIQGMVLVVGGMLGPVAVVVFSTTRTLTRLALQLVTCISYAAEPEFAAMLGTEDTGRIGAFYRRTMRLSLWISLVTIAGLAVLGPTILRRWTHGTVALNPVLFGLLLATVLSQTLWNGALSMLKACNRHLNAAAGQLVAAAFALVLALLLLSVFKSTSAAGIAIFLADLGFLGYSIIEVRRVLGIDMVSTLIAALDPRSLMSQLRWPFHA